MISVNNVFDLNLKIVNGVISELQFKIGLIQENVELWLKSSFPSQLHYLFQRYYDSKKAVSSITRCSDSVSPIPSTLEVKGLP